jgi:hypothetical protein
MKETHITVELRPRNTLAEAWNELAKQFAEGGADKYQIGTMMTVFYLGAAQAYARIDGNTKSFPSFCEIMRDVHVEIDDVIGRELNVAGHA